LLPSRLTAAGGFGFLDRAEPARALGDLHLDLRVPAAGRLVIDALARAVDITLDGAVGRGRDFAGSRSEQDGTGIRRRLGRAEDRGLLVAHAPVPRREEGALPHPGLGFARGLLVGVVVMREAGVGQRPAVRDQPFLDVLAIGLAARHGMAAAVDGAGVAGPASVAEMFDQFVPRGDAAGPALALRVEAKLVGRRRVDAAEANAGRAD